MGKSLVKILIGLFLLTSDVIAAASVGYGRGSDQLYQFVKFNVTTPFLSACYI